MNYQVWTKLDYGESWTKTDCGDLEVARRQLEEKVRAGCEPLLTVEVPYSVAIKVEEGKIGKATESEPKVDKGPRSESTSEVQRGATPELPTVDKGSRSDSPPNSV